MKERVDSVSQHELPTYQAVAAVVRTAGILVPTCDLGTYFSLSLTQSTVLAGIESQLLVFLQISSGVQTLHSNLSRSYYNNSSFSPTSL